MAPRPLVREPSGRDDALASGGHLLFHGLGLRPFRTLGDLEFDLVPSVQGLVPGLANRRVMDEDIRTVVLRDESEPFVGIKLLHGSVHHGMILLAWDGKRRHT
jgi:hypothetical protein